MNMRCPTCDSPHPELHPAMQWEGEVQPCRDLFHLPATIETKRRQIQALGLCDWKLVDLATINTEGIE